MSTCIIHSTQNIQCLVIIPACDSSDRPVPIGSNYPAAYPRSTCESYEEAAGHVALLAMESVVRDKWPLYVVTQHFCSRLPIQLDKLVFVTSSFAFARLACCCLGRSCHSWFDVLRVTHHSRCLPVGQQSSDFALGSTNFGVNHLQFLQKLIASFV